MHVTCGNVFSSTPNRFLRGGRCRICRQSENGRRRFKGHENFLQQVKERYGDEYTVLSTYQGAHIPIKLQHTRCGTVWESTRPRDFLKENANTCPLCSHPSRCMGHAEFVQRVRKLHGNEYTVKGRYVNLQTKILMRHNKCGHNWKVAPTLFIHSKRGCPKCAAFRSKLEEATERFLRQESIKYHRQWTHESLVHIRPLKIDFFLPEYDIAIECDGEQHSKPSRLFGKEEFEKQRERDAVKEKFCEENGITLIRIPHFVKDIEQWIAKELA